MSNHAATQPRQPRGVPTGGQWRATARPEGPSLMASDIGPGPSARWELARQARPALPLELVVRQRDPDLWQWLQGLASRPIPATGAQPSSVQHAAPLAPDGSGRPKRLAPVPLDVVARQWDPGLWRWLAAQAMAERGPASRPAS